MEILGLKVRHAKLGVGTITHRAGNLFIVTFPARHAPKLREYAYPDAFADTLEARAYPRTRHAVNENFSFLQRLV